MQERIHIERMSYGSAAIGHLENGKTVFVEGGAPGDVVNVELDEEKLTFARAHVVEIIEPSPMRMQTACPHALSCGACSWAHLSYEAQLEAKRANVVSALVRTAHLSEEHAQELVGACVASEVQLHYRNKIEMLAHTDEKGAFNLGFSRENTHELVYADACPLAQDCIKDTPRALRGALRFAQGAQDLGIFRVGVRGSERTGAKEVALWTPPSAFPRARVAQLVQSALGDVSVVRVMAQPGKERKIKGIEKLAGSGSWSEELVSLRYKVSAPSFFQVNTAQAEKLIDLVLTGLGGKDKLDGAYVADLYAGGGTFTLPLARAGAQVVAVESAASSVRDLRYNAKTAEVDIEIIGGDAARELPELGELDALVVDPPRAGLAKGVPESIEKAGPGSVAYVSCDVATLARDIARLSALGYEPISVTPVDMFPQTYHVETVVLMSRNKE